MPPVYIYIYIYIYEMLQKVRGEEIKYKSKYKTLSSIFFNTLSEDLITFCVETAFHNRLLKER